tara:strand:+ start:146 stop:358 length:213 start_codon:yes stop_codon:yes gene_type:complete
MKNIIEDKEFKITRFHFKGFPTDQWVVKVLRTWDDGEGYSGSDWRDIGVFDTKEECESWVDKQTLIKVEV